MKTLHLFIVAIATMGSASAALYTLQTGTGAAINGIANSAGLAYQTASTTGLPSGAGSFGYFNATDAQIGLYTTAAQFANSFVLFGGPTTFAVAGPIGQKGAVSVAGSQIVTGSAFNGKNIYFLITNNVTTTAATEFGVFKTSFTFDAAQDAIPTPNVLVPTPTNSTIVFGGPFITDLKTTTTDASINQGFATKSLVVIPEPSTALLGALATFSLLRRRRN